LGDPETEANNVTQKAEDKYRQEIIKRDKFDGKLDMEPLTVLLEMIRDIALREVDGAIQIGKIYRSGINEFFGVMWPSINGNPSFLGRVYSKHAKPRIKYFDPDTCEVIEEEIPKSLVNIDDFNGSEDYEFLRECYSRENYFIKEKLTESEKERLITIFREHSYKVFLEAAEKNLELSKPLTKDKNE
jgi:hypothetical protein